MELKQRIFTCPLTKYKIEYTIDKNVAIMGEVICDYKHIKPFLLLMRLSIRKLKKEKIQTIRQTVNKNDWMLYLDGKTTWKIINDDKLCDAYDVECHIDEFKKNYGIGIGIEDFI